jgi:hypothetical protein
MFFGSIGGGFFSTGAFIDLSDAAGVVATTGGGAWSLDGFSSDDLAGVEVCASALSAQRKVAVTSKSILIMDFVWLMAVGKGD